MTASFGTGQRVARIEPIAWRYRGYGLPIHSAFELPLYPDTVPDPGPPAIDVAALPPRAVELPADAGRVRFEMQAGRACLEGLDIGRYEIEAGSPVRIAVTPAPHASAALIAHSVASNVIALALFFHGYLTLHGAAVRVGGRTLVLLGHAGAGKSTLCAALCRAGGRMLTEDAVAIDWHEGRPRVWPAYPRFKLMPEAAAALGIDFESLAELHEGHPKRAWIEHAAFHPEPAPIDRVIGLGYGERALRTMDQKEAFRLIQGNAFPSIVGFEAGAGQFAAVARLAREVPCALFTREHSLDNLPDQTEWLIINDL